MKKFSKAILRSFRKSDGGNVALIFGLAVFPMIGLTGAAIDYNRASQVRAKMAVAADAAVLVAVKATNMSMAQRRAAADATFAANLGTDSALLAFNGQLIKLGNNSYRYEATGTYSYAVMKVLPGMGNSTQLAAAAEASAGEGTTEVALVLDNTGSMANDMTALRRAATDFTNTLFDQAGGGGATSALKMSVVPYVTAVNPGRLNLGMASVDVRGDSTHNAMIMRTRHIGNVADCRNNPFWVSPPGGGGGGGGGGPPGPGVGRGGRGVWLTDTVQKFADAGRELFGIRAANAQVGTYGTPNRTAPWAGVTSTLNPPYVPAPVTVLMPTGFTFGAPCDIANPARISHLDLFDGLRTRSGSRVQWKGCVEARPEPFDVTDDSPIAGNPNTQFTPYFWPDEAGLAARGRHRDM